MCSMKARAEDAQSPSSRRAWIEIGTARRSPARRIVALLAEGVDRNRSNGKRIRGNRWSPSSRRAWIEMMEDFGSVIGMGVALLAEGVDRNRTVSLALAGVVVSPSSRRAWIEIGKQQRQNQPKPSPSSRRAWIEIYHTTDKTQPSKVALLAEGVDRNLLRHVIAVSVLRRPPRGGRG